ncbi:conserved hypothetical protein [Aromatoleum aromaticum EbN1]|uniref:Bacteriophage-related protein n=1 Tax=Aromatoleum aromaticum (strain DSM 19018 / LMG 30748 / EbN1) TaxID=76114 RepID=Q5NXH7_AROAE|nr:head decoration protein [Aromatoleum aromaticum]CAI10237.1 conserved hypothetical protein [Aromatoleum aromaticum EbN1]
MLQEQKRAGEFLIAEGNGSLSRENIVIASGSGALVAGTVLGKVTASGEYGPYDNDDTTTGLGAAAGILYAPVDATSAATAAVLIARHAEVDGDLLTGLDATGTADLAALQIIVR